MSDKTKATSGAITDTSGSVTDETSTSGDAPSRGSEEIVLKLKKEKENWKTKALELEGKLKERDESELKAKEDFKKLYEAEKKTRETVSAELEMLRQEKVQAKLNSAIRKELLKYGLAPEHTETALKLFDRSQVTLDPDTNVVVGAELAAKSFYEKHAALGFFKKPGTGVNQVGAQMNKVEPTDFNKMPLKQKYEYLSKNMKR